MARGNSTIESRMQMLTAVTAICLVGRSFQPDVTGTCPCGPRSCVCVWMGGLEPPWRASKTRSRPLTHTQILSPVHGRAWLPTGFPSVSWSGKMQCTCRCPLQSQRRGPDETIRTSDLLSPKQARYQLRHTRMILQ